MKYYIFPESQKYFEHRKTYFTASEIIRLLANPTAPQIKKGQLLSDGALTYIDEIVTNHIADVEQERYTTDEMQRGLYMERPAVLEYAIKHGYDINSNDFIYPQNNEKIFYTDDDDIYGYTPDILLPDRIVEIKCPKQITHKKNLLLFDEHDFMKAYPKYYAQMQLGMFLTNKLKGDFVSYDDRFKNPEHHMREIEVTFNPEYVENILVKIHLANKEKESQLSQLS